MIIIGSTALKHWFPDFKSEPKDLDYAVSNASLYRSAKGVEYLENPVILKYSKGKYLEPELLLTLKMSHLFYEINWDKHMFHVQFLLDKGVKYNKEVFDELVEYWKQTKPPVKRSDLNMSKEEFFTNAINYNESEHDDLHLLINPVPMYTKLLKEGEEVEICENKFVSLTYEEKLEVVREEVYVMAYERYKNLNFRQAHKIMLSKFIRQHAPIWMMLFAIENYKKLINPNINFIKTIENGLRKI
jgi:hypothetical protein